jgi:hypothetical protein
LPKQVYKRFQEIKKALALFRVHQWFDYLLSPLPKVDILIAFHRERGEKRAVPFPEFHPCRGVKIRGFP